MVNCLYDEEFAHKCLPLCPAIQVHSGCTVLKENTSRKEKEIIRPL